MKRILISTKLKTTNIGNQALSDELIKLASEFSENYEFIVKGRPFGLDKYTFDYFEKNDPVFEFEKIANRIAKDAMSLESQNFTKSDLHKIKTNLLDVEGSVVKTERLREIARKIRKLYYSFFLYSNAYKNRLKIYNSIDYYLYSGAGEVSKQDFYLRQLLDLRIAQIMGVKVCAINQSVEIDSNIENALMIHVYSKMHKIVVRGNISRDSLVKKGVNPNIITVAPDTAFRTDITFDKKEVFKKNIAINITPKKYLKEKFDNLISELLKQNYKITFVTNQPVGERELAIYLNQKFNIDAVIKSFNYIEYSEYLKQFDFLISTRLHSNELALTVGVPVIPIEGNIFKTTEVLSFVKYPIDVLKISDSEFEYKIQKNIEFVESNFIEIQDWIKANLHEISNNSKKNISEVF